MSVEKNIANEKVMDIQVNGQKIMASALLKETYKGKYYVADADIIYPTFFFQIRPA